MTKTDAPQALRSSGPATPADAAVAGQDAIEARFKPGLTQAPYFSVGRNWEDYAPAYRFGRDCRQRHEGRRFDEVADELEQAWADARDQSRLGWIEARGAVEDAWALSPDDASQDDAAPHPTSPVRPID